MNLKHLIIFSIALLSILSGCSKLSSPNTADVSGSEGIELSFVRGTPPDRFFVGQAEEPFSIQIEARNKGAYPRENDFNLLDIGTVHVSGFDPDVIELDSLFLSLDETFLEGASSINPDGGFDIITFGGEIIANNIIIDTYSPTILATVCYPYETKTSPTVCVDPFPYDELQRKVCYIGSQRLGTQGAPVAVTQIEQEANANSIQFKITIENVGNGDVIHPAEIDRCNPYFNLDLDREHFNRVELLRATVGLDELDCKPLDAGRTIRLNDGSGFVICSLDRYAYQDATTAYETPLTLELRYGYRSTISKQIDIIKLVE